MFCTWKYILLHHCSCWASKHFPVLFSRLTLLLAVQCVDLPGFLFWGILEWVPCRHAGWHSTLPVNFGYGSCWLCSGSVHSCCLAIQPGWFLQLPVGFHPYLFQPLVLTSALPVLSADWFIRLVGLAQFLLWTLFLLADPHQNVGGECWQGAFLIPFCIGCQYYIIGGTWISSVGVLVLQPRGLPKIVSKGLWSESMRTFHMCIDGIISPQKQWTKAVSRFECS